MTAKRPTILADRGPEGLTRDPSSTAPARARSGASGDREEPGPALPAEPASADAGPRRRRFRPGWVLGALFVGYPLWWVLGLSGVIWPILAFPLLLALLTRDRVRAPRGFGLWLAFLAWTAFSSIQVQHLDRWAAYFYRGSIYLTATVLFLYVYNASPLSLPGSRVIKVLAGFWAVVAVGGILGALFPHVHFTSVVEHLLPDDVAANGFVHALVHPEFADVQRILGYPVGRPKAPFPYTNAWGGTFALLAPFVLAAWPHLRTARARWLAVLVAVASVLPVVVSLDRGLWVSLGLGLVYAAVRFALQGRGRPLAGVMLILALSGVLVVATPLQRIFSDRIATPHSDEGRLSLYQEALEKTKASPLLGYGTPVESESPDHPSVGTHGQLWLVLVSTGVPGTMFFMGWLGYLLWRSRRGSPEAGIWLHVVLFIAAVQTTFYGQLPAGVPVYMVAAALTLRRTEAKVAAGSPRSATVSATPRDLVRV